jgi:hypothetical protein
MCTQSDLQYGKQLHTREATVVYSILAIHGCKFARHIRSDVRQLLSMQDDMSIPVEASS